MLRQRAIILRAKGVERALDEERAAVLFEAPLREAKVVAHLFRETETMSRERGNPIAIVDNRPRQKDEGELEAGSSSNAEAT